MNTVLTRKKQMTPSEILEVFRLKSIDKEWSFAEYKPSERRKWTHDYHRYPAKFIPQLVEKLFDNYIGGAKAHINDPFLGCGTTIVSAISRGYKASGTDINKVAYLVTKVKSTPISPDLLDKKLIHFLNKLDTLAEKQLGLYEKDLTPIIPHDHKERIKHWFDEENIKKLGLLLCLISEERNERIRNFYLVSFSHILKNCSFWLQSSTKPTRDNNKQPSDPFLSIRKHLKHMQKGNQEFYSIVPTSVKGNIERFLNIKDQDARTQPVENDSMDLIVTSSPYVTSYEYADLHQLSTLWLSLTDDLKKYKGKFIGTAYKRYEDKELSSEIGKKIVKEMQKNNFKIGKEIEAFFLDMQEVFNESYRILKPGGRCCYVIGNTKLKGVDILNAEVFTESLQHSGFMIDRIVKREIPSKLLPQTRDEKTGRFASVKNANTKAYPTEYIVIGLKE